MFTWILAVIVVLVLIVTVLIARQPESFRIVRSVTVNAPSDIPFALVNDFHQWAQWSPFDKLDPNLQRTFSGAPSGVTARYEWSGNSRAGKGTMTILKSVPNERIDVDLYFEKPFKARNPTEFVFTPDGNSVNVAWIMSGTNSTMGKMMGLVMNMDKWLGGQFEEGLGNLKRVSEAQARGA